MARFSAHRALACTLAALLLLGATGLAGALSQVGQTFPGFLLLGNRVVASIGLSLWPATAGGEIFQHQIVAVDGAPVERVEEVHAWVRALPAGEPVRYRMRSGEREIVRTIATRAFGWRDFVLLHGLYLVNGLCLGTAGLVALWRRRDAAARACAPLLLTGAFWVLTALDLYGPYHLFRIHALCEALLFPAALLMALGFPEPARCLQRRPWLPRALYAAAACLAVAYQAGLGNAGAYVATHLLAVTAFGVALVTLVVAEVERLRRPLALESRERLRVVAIGALVALVLPVALTLAEVVTGGRSPQNALALTGAVFPLAVAYALLRGGFPSPEPVRP
jgi:hypothetical protein